MSSKLILNRFGVFIFLWDFAHMYEGEKVILTYD